MSIDAGLLFALIGCLVGVAGWVANLIRRTSKDAEWRGTVSGKLNGIQLSVTGMQDRYDKLDEKVDKMSEKLTAVESSAKSAHHRIDGLEARKGE